MVKKYLLTFTSLTAIALLPVVANAANEQRLPGVIDKDLPKVEVPKPYSLDKKKAEPIEKPPVRGAGSESVVATLKSVKFEGNTVVSTEELQEVVSPFIGKKITGADLEQIKYDLTRVFYDKGYILVKIVTPPQSISNGVLTVKVFEAKVGEVIINDPEGALNPAIANAITSRIDSGDVFREKPVESTISDLDQLENIHASMNLQPGKKFSTTDLHVAIENAQEEEQSIAVDNYGSELTGRVVGAAHLEKKNLLNLGEEVYTDLRRSSGDLWSANVGTVVPLPLHNLKLEANYLHSYNEIGDRLAALDATGETDSVNVALASNLLNTKDHQIVARVGLDARQHESFRSDITETEDDIRRAYVGASYLFRALDSVFYLSSRVSKGLDVLGASEQGDALATRAAGDPEAWLFEPLFIAQSRALHPDGSLKVVASGQLASDTLLSSDLFSLGGYGSVRGFEPAEETGEAGYQFTVEYNHDIPVDAAWNVSAGPFLDGGAVYNRVPGQTLDNHLYSAGLGLEINTQFMPDINPTTIRLDWAHPLGDYNSPEVDDDMIYFRVSQTF